MTFVATSTTPPTTTDDVAASDRLCVARVLLAGVGNIGSFLALLLAPSVAFIRLVDRDLVERHNTTNQMYSPDDVGRSKVDVTADRIRQLAPQVEIERRVADLEDLPWGDFADVDCVVAGLDSLRARQIVSEKVYPLRIPYIDGGVGDPLVSRVQVLLPGQACLQCSWGAGQYRQLTAEHPCRPGAPSAGPRTLAPGCAGAATASVMVAQLIRLLGDDPPQQSYEINGDLLTGRMTAARRRVTPRCRFAHEAPPQLLRLAAPLAKATVDDLLAAVVEQFGEQTVQLEFRRGLLDGDLFGAGRFAMSEHLRPMRHRRLVQFGLTLRDRVVVRSSGRAAAAHVCFDTTAGA